MQKCPACSKHVRDGADCCPFCGGILGPGTAPSTFRSLPSLEGRANDEPHTLNWFVLIRRCLHASGRFSRSEFAVAYLGTLALFWALMIALVVGSQAAGFTGEPADMLTGLVTLVCVPFVFIAAVGGSIRRWHDLGQSGWMVLLNLIPCVGLFVILYLLFAPGQAGPGRVESTPVLAIVAGVLVFGVCGVGMISAIAIPSLLRARVSANEAATIGDIRTVVSSQEAYRAANDGLYESNLQCLVSPFVGCIPGYPANGPAFLDAPLAARQPRHGYEWRFEPGRVVAVDPARSSPTSTGAYAVVALPIKPGQTGIRSFCGDSTGLVCFRPDGGAIEALGGACPTQAGGCTPIR